MEQRLANSLLMTVNEKKFIEDALLSDIRIDGRRPFDYRNLTIRFGSEDGSSEVQLGQTQVIGFVTGQLVQPYRDRPNEGTFAIYTEFSPMADPSFEPGRPGDSAIELGRIVDRGLRESRAVDTESLCVIAGKLVWSIRIDLHIIDNGGNLLDAANVAALAALSTFRRPECTFGGEDGQELIIHPPEVREPLPLIIHHYPVAVTFGFIGKDNIVVIDPTHYEEAVMGGSMTATLNTNGDVCAIQKAGGDGVLQSVIMQCLRIASVKAGDITSKIKTAVESYNTQRSLRKIKRHNPDQHGSSHVAKHHMGRSTFGSDESSAGSQSNEHDRRNKRNSTLEGFSGGPASWDPYSSGIDADALRASLGSRATPIDKHKEESTTQANPETQPSKQWNEIPNMEENNNKPFNHEVVWKILKDHPQWNEISNMEEDEAYTPRSSKRSKSTSEQNTTSSDARCRFDLNEASNENEYEVHVQEPQRPIGKDKAKRAASTTSTKYSENTVASLKGYVEKIAIDNDKLISVETDIARLKREKVDIMRQREERKREEKKQKDLEFFISSHEHLEGAQLNTVLKQKEHFRQKYDW